MPAGDDDRVGWGSLPALLTLADGRFPVGGHAHSGGIEAAVGDGRVTDLADLESFVVGRLETAGRIDAALAAATVLRLSDPTGGGTLGELRAVDREADARLPVAHLRAASRRLGRQLARVARGCWTDPLLVVLDDVDPDGAHQSVALGAVAVAAGLGPVEAAMLSLHHTVSTPVQAALKVAGLDPFAIAALTIRLGPRVAELAAESARHARLPLRELPCGSGPLVEIAAAGHHRNPSRLFAT